MATYVCMNVQSDLIILFYFFLHLAVDLTLICHVDAKLLPCVLSYILLLLFTHCIKIVMVR